MRKGDLHSRRFPDFLDGVILALRLGLRFAVPKSFSSSLRFATIGLLSFIIVLSCLCLLSGARIVSAQEERERHRTPSEEISGGGSANVLVETVLGDWRGRDLTRVVLSSSGGDGSTHPPGISRNPRAGEVLMSPAMLSVVRSDPDAAGFLASGELVGLIDPDGLRSPDELRMIQGVDRPVMRAAGAVPVAEFGVGDDVPTGLSPFELTFFPALMLLLIFVPTVGALTLTARMLSDRTDHRFALLRSLGLSVASCRAIAAIEVAPAAMFGTSFSLLTHEVMLGRVDRLPATSLWFFPGDAEIAFSAILLGALVGLTCTMLAAGFGARVPTVMASSRPGHQSVGRRSFLTAVFAVGCLQMGAATVLDPDLPFLGGKQGALMGAGICMVGAPAVVRALAAFIGTHLNGMSTRAGGLVGSRWGMSNPTATRLAVILTLGLTMVGMLTPVANSLEQDTSAAQAALAASRGYNFTVDGPNLSPSALSRMPGVGKVIPVLRGESREGQEVWAVVTTCARLSRFAHTEGCRPDTQWIESIETPVEGYVPMSDMTFDSREVPRPDVRRPVRAPLGTAYHGAVKVEPDQFGQPRRKIKRVLVNLPAGEQSIPPFTASLASLAPAALATNGNAELVAQGSAYDSYLRVLVWTLCIGLFALSLGFVSVAVRSVRERRDALRFLIRLGARRRTCFQAHWLAISLPLASGLATGCATLALFWTALRQVDPESQMSTPSMIALVAAAIALTLVVPFLTLPAVLEREGGPSTR